MEAPFHKVGQINISLTLGAPNRILVNAAQASAPIASRGMKFYDVETVTEYYELTPEMEADIEQKKQEGTLLFAVRKIMYFDKEF